MGNKRIRNKQCGKKECKFNKKFFLGKMAHYCFVKFGTWSNVLALV